MSDLNEQALKLLQDLESRHQHVLDELDALNERVETVLKNYAREEELRLGVPQEETNAKPQASTQGSGSTAPETQEASAPQEERKAA